MPGERIEQRFRGACGHAGLSLHQAAYVFFRYGSAHAAAGMHQAQQVARRFGRVQRVLGQAHVEGALHPEHELDPREAVQAEVALERAVERGVRLLAVARVVHHLIDHGDQRSGAGFGFVLIHQTGSR